MYIIRKSFEFSASHRLAGLPEHHPCSRHHGHNYVVTVELSAERLDGVGFVLDYRTLDKFKQWINDSMDHRHLNEVFPAMNPTAENLAETLCAVATEMFGERVSLVAVSETPRTVAEYVPPGHWSTRRL